MAKLTCFILITLLAGNPQAHARTQSGKSKQSSLEKLKAVLQAIEQYKKDVLENPDSAEAYFNLGLAYNRAGLFYESDALRAFEQAISLKPNYPEAYLRLAWLYQKQDRFNDAIEACKQALGYKPDYSKAYSALGSVYVSLDRDEDAAESFLQAIKLDPQNAAAHSSLGNLYKNQERYEEAIDAFNAGLRIKPDEIYMGLRGRGEVYVKLGRYEEAIKTYKEIIQISPNSSTAYYHLGSIYASIGDKESALEQYEALKSIENRNQEQDKFGVRSNSLRKLSEILYDQIQKMR
jgi:tetratricopeptide (TPR) repeat protein